MQTDNSNDPQTQGDDLSTRLMEADTSVNGGRVSDKKKSAKKKKKESLTKKTRKYFQAPVLLEPKLPEACYNVKPYEFNEVKALLRFVIDKGIQIDKDLLQDLVSLIRCAEKTGVKQLDDQQECALVARYNELTALVYPQYGVTGRTIIDSARFSNTAILSARVWGVTFFLLAVVPGLLHFNIPQDHFLYPVLDFLRPLSPFFWGGVGASIFLLKTLGEIASNSKFDSRKIQGISTRIFLGAAIAYVVVSFLALTEVLNTASANFTFTKEAIAFIAGLGFKAVYGILEMIIESISTRVRGRPV